MAIVSNGFYCEAVCFSPVNFYSDCQNSFLSFFLSFFGGGGEGGGARSKTNNDFC